MGFREVRDADCRRILEGILAMRGAQTLEDTALTLVNTAMDLVACDHAGYAEVDEYFGRTRLYSSETEISDWVRARADTWHRFLPSHPVLSYRKVHPDVPIVRLSDVTDLSSFYGSGIYRELFREVETDHQLVMDLGFDPKRRAGDGALPLALSVPMNRKGRDFTDRDIEVMTLLQSLARPVLRHKRAIHQYTLLQQSRLTPELLRSLVGLGLTERQAEVSFWMLKSKSNADIGAILEIGEQTVRQHSIAIYRKLGVSGRMDLLRTVLLSLTET